MTLTCYGALEIVGLLLLFLSSASMIPRDLEEITRKWYEWQLLRTVAANEGVVEQHAIESFHQDGQTLSPARRQIAEC